MSHEKSIWISLFANSARLIVTGFGNETFFPVTIVTSLKPSTFFPVFTAFLSKSIYVIVKEQSAFFTGAAKRFVTSSDADKRIDAKIIVNFFINYLELVVQRFRPSSTSGTVQYDTAI